MTRVLPVLFVCLAVVAAGPAAAQGTDQGLLNAVAYQPVPADTAIRVRPLDNSDDNLVVQKDLEEALRGAGYTVAEDAPLVLTFEIRNEQGAWSDSGTRTLLELQARGGETGGESARARFNIFDSGRGGLLNRGRGKGTTIVTPTMYRLDATLDDRTAGRRLWQAWTTAPLGQWTALPLTRAMVPAVVDNIGQTVRRQPFALR